MNGKLWFKEGSKEQRAFAAEAALRMYYAENPVSDEDVARRLHEVKAAFQTSGTYVPTTDELTGLAKVEWRNSTRCVGRLHWQKLMVLDFRAAETEEDIFEGLLEHLRKATNEGRIRSHVSVFPAKVPGETGTEIRNYQLVRYAGYRLKNGLVMGDPMEAAFTEEAIGLGWRPPRKPGRFDPLPVIIQLPNGVPKRFEIPREEILEVPIEHPDFAWFSELRLKWYAVPIVTNMVLDVGGVAYTAAPFNGWYLGTEIGARNFGDNGRYNLLPVVARRMGLDLKRNRTLWKDKALIELNLAVLHSFAKNGVRIANHHMVDREFMEFCRYEQDAGRNVRADWSWLIPPTSASTVEIFHHSGWNDEPALPNFFYQEKVRTRKETIGKKNQCPFAG